jgi:hypothetical protein
MSKFLTISTIIIGIVIIFNAGGIETPAGGLVFQFLDGGLAAFKQSALWTTLATILTVGITGGVIAGLFGRAPPESYLIAALVFTLGGAVLTDSIAIYLILWGLGIEWIRWVVTSIFIPLIFIYFGSLISFWRGADG